MQSSRRANTIQSHMDGIYSRPELYWGKEPNDLCKELCNLLSPGEAEKMELIDLGAGEGRDAIHFARHGFNVTALDSSQPGLEKAQRWAREEGLKLRTIHADLLSFRLNQPINVLYSSGTLHYLPQHLRREVFENFKRFTRAGGLNAFNVFVEKPFLDVPPDYTADEFFFRSGELSAYYWDWEILSISEIIFDCQSSGVPHRHAMEIIIVRKMMD